jgi:hypothetical protein
LWWNKDEGALKIWYVDGTSNQWVDASTGAIGAQGAQGAAGGGGGGAISKALTIASPVNTDNISLFFTNTAITFSRFESVLRGSGSPSVTYTIKHGSDRSAAGTEVKSGGVTVTSTTTHAETTTFDNAAVSANSFIWILVSSVSGTVDELNVTLFYT